VVIGNNIATTLATKQNFPFPVTSIVAGVSTVFWPSLGSSPTTANGQVVAAPGQGGVKPSTFFSNLANPYGIALDPPPTPKYFYVAVKGGIKTGDGAILKVPFGYNNGTLAVTTSAALVLAQPVPLPTALAVDYNNVYFIGSNAGTGVVMRASLSTGTKAPTLPPAPTTLASGGSPAQIAIDANNVYWTDTIAGTISAVPIAGGTPTVLVSGQDAPVGLAVDANNLYWTTSSAVMRMPLPAP
jgi:sugar lactone lactonase YvrE